MISLDGYENLTNAEFRKLIAEAVMELQGEEPAHFAPLPPTPYVAVAPEVRNPVYNPGKRMWQYENEHGLTRFATDEQFAKLTKQPVTPKDEEATPPDA